MRSHKIGWALALAGILGMASAQTCRDDIRATAPDNRFTDHGNGTVTDLSTGLIWKQCAEGLSGAGCATGSPATFTWPEALQQAADAVYAGSSLWRLPNKNELASLVEQRCGGPAINSRLFPNTPIDGWFWSSSPMPIFSSSAWYIYFLNGDVYYAFKNGAEYVRLVRGGPALSFALSIAKPGRGAGRVTTVPGGIDCGSVCTARARGSPSGRPPWPVPALPAGAAPVAVRP